MSNKIQMEVTLTEKALLQIIRERKPFEIVKIMKDQSGKQDTYLVERSQKYVLNQQKVVKYRKMDLTFQGD